MSKKYVVVRKCEDGTLLYAKRFGRSNYDLTEDIMEAWIFDCEHDADKVLYFELMNEGVVREIRFRLVPEPFEDL